MTIYTTHSPHTNTVMTIYTLHTISTHQHTQSWPYTHLTLHTPAQSWPYTHYTLHTPTHSSHDHTLHSPHITHITHCTLHTPTEQFPLLSSGQGVTPTQSWPYTHCSLHTPTYSFMTIIIHTAISTHQQKRAPHQVVNKESYTNTFSHDHNYTHYILHTPTELVSVIEWTLAEHVPSSDVGQGDQNCHHHHHHIQVHSPHTNRDGQCHRV